MAFIILITSYSVFLLDHDLVQNPKQPSRGLEARRPVHRLQSFGIISITVSHRQGQYIPDNIIYSEFLLDHNLVQNPKQPSRGLEVRRPVVQPPLLRNDYSIPVSHRQGLYNSDNIIYSESFLDQ